MKFTLKKSNVPDDRRMLLKELIWELTIILKKKKCIFKVINIKNIIFSRDSGFLNEEENKQKSNVIIIKMIIRIKLVLHIFFTTFITFI